MRRPMIAVAVLAAAFAVSASNAAQAPRPTHKPGQVGAPTAAQVGIWVAEGLEHVVARQVVAPGIGLG